MRRALLALPALLLFAGCGYHLVGTASTLPPDLKTLHVEVFKNSTGWADVDQRLSESLTAEWVRRRRYVLVDDPKDADIVLRGRILSVRSTPVTVDSHGRATEYQMTLTVSAELLDVRGKKPKKLWADKGFSRRTSYPVDIDAVDYFDRQTQAIEDVSRELARDLVTAVLEGF